MPRILCLDCGLKRTGIAVTDELQIIASGLTTVPSATAIDFLKDYFAKEKVEKVIVKKTRGVKKVNPVTLVNEKGDSGKINRAKSSTKKKMTKSDLSTENGGDDGLPTLNKVLAAYAKSTGSKGKIGDIN